MTEYQPPPGPPPRAPGAGFPADMVIGIIIIVLSVCAGLAGLLALIGVGFLGAAIGQAALEEGSRDAAAAAGAVGSIAAVATLILLVSAVLSIATGVGIMRSARWGFILGVVLYGLNLLFNLVAFNILAILISGGLFAYCLLRLIGQVGPKPA